MRSRWRATECDAGDEHGPGLLSDDIVVLADQGLLNPEISCLVEQREDR